MPPVDLSYRAFTLTDTAGRCGLFGGERVEERAVLKILNNNCILWGIFADNISLYLKQENLTEIYVVYQ
jgi:hypothetical protein